MNNLYLVGMMGSGKTVVSEILSHELNRNLEDLDENIVKKEEKSINDIFDNFGESYFRRVEKEVLAEVASKKDLVVSTGGGIVLDNDNIDLMHQSGIIIYLKASTDLLFSRLKTDTDRPLLKTDSLKATLDDIFSKRASLYEKANFSVDTFGKTPLEVACEIVEVLIDKKIVSNHDKND